MRGGPVGPVQSAAPPPVPIQKSAMDAPVSPSKWVPNVDRSRADPQAVKAAEGMEAMFLDYMMQAMRKTVPKNEMDLESPATEIYRGMMDSETAKTAARSGGIGLADQIIAYLESQRYTQGRGQEARARSAPLGTGGTHEGKSGR